MNEREATAAIRIIGAIARADGKVTDAEKAAFRAAIADFNPPLPDGTTVEQLLAEDVDLDAELGHVTSNVMKRAIFEVAVTMSLADGATAEENKLLSRIRAAFSLEDEVSLLGAALRDRKGITASTDPLIDAILDPAQRTQRVREIMNQKALLAAVFGAIPVPFVSDLGVLYQIDGVVAGVAMLWGHPLTRAERVARFGVWLSIASAQVAVHSLIKLIPGWGSVAGAVGGAVTGYLMTYAVGGVVNYHFERDGKATAEELRKVFAEQKIAAKRSYEENKGAIDAARAARQAELTELGRQLDKNEITLEEFRARVSAFDGP